MTYYENSYGQEKKHVPKKICTLPQTFGGLYMVDLLTLNKVKRIHGTSESWANWKLGITVISIH